MGSPKEFTDDKGIYVICPHCGSKRYRTGEREFLGKKYPSYEDCKTCIAERTKKEAQTKIDNERKAKLDERNRLMDMLEKSNIGRKYYPVSFDTLKPDISPTFHEDWERLQKFSCPEVLPKVMEANMGFYLYGKNGRGKTALVVAVIKRLIVLGYSCYITTMDELGQALLKNKIDLDKVEEVDFLAIDDVGTEKLEKEGDKNWYATLLYDITSARDKNLKLTVFTSNLSMEELAKRGMEVKVLDRIQALSPVKLFVDTPKSYRLKENREILF